MSLCPDSRDQRLLLLASGHLAKVVNVDVKIINYIPEPQLFRLNILSDLDQKDQTVLAGNFRY